MFNGLPMTLPGSLNAYGPNNLPRKDPSARYVRTLPMLMNKCVIRTFVELWTLCQSRSEKFYETREEKNEERNTTRIDNQRQNKSLSSQKTEEENDDDINKQEERKRKLRKFRNGRRDGQLVMEKLPFFAVVKVSQFLRHNPVIRFSRSSFHLGYHRKFFFTLDIVEDMEFDLNKVVSFCLRASIDGKVVDHTRFFLNRDMTFGISFEPPEETRLFYYNNNNDGRGQKKNTDDDVLSCKEVDEKQLQKIKRMRHLFQVGLAENDQDEELMKEALFFRTPGVMLFDCRFLEMKGLMCDDKGKADAFGSKWTVEGKLM